MTEYNRALADVLQWLKKYNTTDTPATLVPIETAVERIVSTVVSVAYAKGVDHGLKIAQRNIEAGL